MPNGLARAFATLLPLLGFGAGVWLTAVGLSAMPEQPHAGQHVPIVATGFGAFVCVALLGRVWPRVSVLPVAACALAAIAAACGALPAVGAVLLLGLSCACAGRLLLPRRLGCGTIEELLVGVALVGTVVGATVHLPIWFRGTFVLLLLAPIALALRHARGLVGRAGNWLGGRRDRAPLPEALLEAAIAAVLVLLFALALMPERGHDALAFHLMVPEHVRWHHCWSFDVEHYVWAVMPMLGDWLHCVSVSLEGEVAARLANFGFVAVLALLVAGLARDAGAGRRAARATALVFVASPLVLCETASLFVDSIWTALLLGGAGCVLRVAGTARGERAEPRDLVVGGLLLGGALAAKAVTFMALPVLALALLVRARTWLALDRLPALLAGGLAFAIVGAVPYARAWLLTGNPVFPFFNGVFQSPLYPGEDFQPPVIFDRGMGWDVLYRVTFESGRFLEASPGAGGFQWLLLVLPATLALAAARQWRGLAAMLVAFGCAFLTFQQTAYLRYVLPTFALALAACGPALSSQFVVSRATLWLGALLALLLNVRFGSTASHHAELRVPALTSEAGRDAFLRETLPLRLAVRAVDTLNPHGNPVAFFAPAMPSGLRADALFPNWYNHRFATAVAEAADPAHLGDLLGARHVRYLLLDDAFRDAVERARVRDCSRPVQRFGGVELRELLPAHRFAAELVQAPELTDAAAWYAPTAVTFGPGGATLSTGAVLNQSLPVTPSREHRLRVAVTDATADADGQLLLVWQDARRRFAGQERLALGPAAHGEHTLAVTAPRSARSAVLSATCTTGTLTLRTISLRH